MPYTLHPGSFAKEPHKVQRLAINPQSSWIYPTKEACTLRKRAQQIVEARDQSTKSRIYPTKEPNKLPNDPKKSHIHTASREPNTVPRFAINPQKSHIYHAKEPNKSPVNPQKSRIYPASERAEHSTEARYESTKEPYTSRKRAQQITCQSAKDPYTTRRKRGRHSTEARYLSTKEPYISRKRTQQIPQENPTRYRGLLSMIKTRPRCGQWDLESGKRDVDCGKRALYIPQERQCGPWDLDSGKRDVDCGKRALYIPQESLTRYRGSLSLLNQRR